MFRCRGGAKFVVNVPAWWDPWLWKHQLKPSCSAWHLSSKHSPRSRPCTNWSGRCMYGFGEIEPKVWVPSLKRRYRSFLWRHGKKNRAVALLGFQAFQRGFIHRNRPRDDEARVKSLEEKSSVPAGGASVPAGGVNCSLYAAMELSSSFSVLGNLLRLVRNESSCSLWSFSAPSWVRTWPGFQIKWTQPDFSWFFMRTIPVAENRGDLGVERLSVHFSGHVFNPRARSNMTVHRVRLPKTWAE